MKKSAKFIPYNEGFKRMKKIIYSLISLQSFLLSTSLFAQEGTEDLPPARDGGFVQTLTMMAIALLFFYFILWRPEQKRRKEMDDLRSQMKPGDKVTAVGIIGTIVKVQEHSVILKMYDGSKIEVVKAAITDLQPANGDESKKIESIHSKE